MGLRESRIINSVNPWLGERLRWLDQVAGIVGIKQSLISGVRTAEKQRQLYDFARDRPAAFPGCSQHEYGFAADAVWSRAMQVTSKGRARLFTQEETNSFMQAAARHVNLSLVQGDVGHVQMYPNSEFKRWAVGLGRCNPNPPPRRLRTSEILCGPGATSSGIDALGRIICEDKFDDILTS